MKKSVLASAVLAVLGASSGYGSITPIITNLGVPTDGDPVAGYGPLPGFTAYRLDFRADPGKVIQGFDFSAQGAPNKTLRLPLHQYWSLQKSTKSPFAVSLVGGNGGKTPSGTNSTNGGPPNVTGIYDSHFVIPDTQLINVGSNLDEDNDAYTGGTTLGPSTSPFAAYNVNTTTGTPNDGWGVGSVLEGAWALQAPLQANVVTAVYFVFPDSFLPFVFNQVFAPEVAQSGSGTETVLVWPEPVSLPLLGASFISIFRRRRRQ